MWMILILLVVYHFLLVGEFFLPTGGTMGMGALVCLVSSVVLAFSQSLFVGVSVSAILLISTPLIMSSVVRIWPNTPIGRRILNRRPGQLTDVKTVKRTRGGADFSDLVGKMGMAKTDLLPSGLVMVEGHKVDAITSGGSINAGMMVVVTEVVAGRVHVRKATEKPPAESGKPTEETSLSPAALEQSLELLDDE